MNNTATIGPRPSNPAEISFARACFRQVGTRTEWVATPPPGSTSYPKRFGTEVEAARTGWAFSPRQVPVMERVSWTGKGGK